MNFLWQLKLQQNGSEGKSAIVEELRSWDEAFEAYEFMHAYSEYADVFIYTVK